MNFRYPSAKRVSKASDDLPDPLTPVMTTSFSRGMETSKSLRLWTRAPFIPIAFSIAQLKPPELTRELSSGQCMLHFRQSYEKLNAHHLHQARLPLVP